MTDGLEPVDPEEQKRRDERFQERVKLLYDFAKHITTLCTATTLPATGTLLRLRPHTAILRFEASIRRRLGHYRWGIGITVSYYAVQPSSEVA